MQLADPVLTVLLGATTLFHAHHPIGIAASGAGYRVNAESHKGKASLSCGDIVESRNEILHLTMGPDEVTLLPLTRGRVCHDGITLESGTIEFFINSRFEIQAGTFRFDSAGHRTRGKISLTQDRRIEASLASGALHALDLTGAVLADITHEHALSIEEFRGGTPKGVPYIGCIEQKGGRYYMRDENSGTTLEVKGPAVEHNLQKRTVVTGVVSIQESKLDSAPFLRASNILSINDSCLCMMK